MTNKRGELLDAAFGLLSDTGDVSQLNLRKIARRAGCAHTNAYNFFPNFEALKWAMLEEALSDLDAHMFASSGKNPEPLELISRYIDFALENKAVYKLIWATDLDTGAAPVDTGFLFQIPGKIAGFLPPETADILHSYVHGKLMNIIYSRYSPKAEESVGEEMLQTCKKIIELESNSYKP